MANPDKDPIKHVILLMLENHSFDQMLGDLKRHYPELEGIDPAVEKYWNDNGRGQRIYQQATRETQMIHDPWHETRDVLPQLENGNSGFVKDFLKNYPDASIQEQSAVMGYYPDGFLPALHPLGKAFTVCDHWFSSLPGPTWPNRFFALTGTSMGYVKMPEHHKDFAMLSNQTQDTVFDRLTEAGRKWNIFYYDFPCSLILKRMREPAKKPHYKKIDEFFSLCEKSESEFPDFAFIEPKFDGFDQNDDHPPHNIMKAQKLIADVYNAVRANEELWKTTLLVVLYDEHGGFFDHVTPPPAIPPDDHAIEYDFKQLGVRVPAILISPWVKARVEKTLFDHTSLLKYLMDKWGLKPLTKRVDQATSIAVAIQPTLRTDPTPQFLRVPAASLSSQHPEWELVDLSRHHIALMAAMEQIASDLGGMEIERKALAEGGPIIGAFYRWKAKMGAKFISYGRSLIDDHRKAREHVVNAITERMLK